MASEPGAIATGCSGARTAMTLITYDMKTTIRYAYSPGPTFPVLTSCHHGALFNDQPIVCEFDAVGQ